MESSDIRQYELKRSIIETFTHPLFGVGPGQFPSFEGRSVKGGQGGWLETHNSFTQISSECGLPAIGLYVSALVSTFVLLSRIRKNAAGRYAREIRTAELCIKIGLVAFTVAIFFVNFGYNFHIPAISGLVIVIWSVVVGQHRRLLSRTARQTVKDVDETDALKDSVEASFRMARASATISGSG
jgi:O-antigen ligase